MKRRVKVKIKTYRVVKTVADGRRLSLEDLPFQAGDEVEVVVRSQARKAASHERYPLRGKPVRYLRPLEGVDVDDWEALK